jgi:hypothetical protein
MGGVEVEPLALLTSALNAGKWLVSHPSCFNAHYLLDRILDGPWSWSGCCTEEKEQIILSCQE